mmetsp:Transcript_53179/g.108200  ORF Transcript_53179/g.108200 Transcript_53179/m.108200 type:complete len:210 (+) Transcript_53179:340-969(+)
MATELSTSRAQLQVGTEEVRLFHQRFHRCCGLVVEPWAIVTSGQNLESNPLNGCTRALIGDARISITVEDNGGGHLGCDLPVEVDHAGLPRRLVAGIVVAGVLPSICWTRPRFYRCILHMKSFLDISAVHPLGRVEVQAFGNGPIQRRRIGKDVELVDVGLLPTLGQTTGSGGHELPLSHLASSIQSCCSLQAAHPHAVLTTPESLRKE